MKKGLKILKSKQVKELLSAFKKKWGSAPDPNLVYLLSDKNKLYVVNRDLGEIDFEKLRINSIGLYIAEVKNTQIRLSIEGSQLVGPKATKNVVEISNEEVKLWMMGENLKKDGDFDGFVIIKHGNDFLGSGKFKDGEIHNYVAKIRRLREVLQ